jgi:hypothetical protein
VIRGFGEGAALALFVSAVLAWAVLGPVIFEVGR